jgi:hypothetical protein
MHEWKSTKPMSFRCLHIYCFWNCKRGGGFCFIGTCATTGSWQCGIRCQEEEAAGIGGRRSGCWDHFS